MNFDLRLMNIPMARMVISDKEYKCTIRMSTNEFKSVCSDLSSIGDTVSITCNQDGIQFNLRGDICNGSITYTHNDEMDNIDDLDRNTNCVFIRCDETVSLNLPMRYLVLFAKANSLSKYVTLFMSSGVPLMTEYRVDNIGHLKYFLAPKIEVD